MRFVFVPTQDKCLAAVAVVWRSGGQVVRVEDRTPPPPSMRHSRSARRRPQAAKKGKRAKRKRRRNGNASKNHQFTAHYPLAQIEGDGTYRTLHESSNRARTHGTASGRTDRSSSSSARESDCAGMRTRLPLYRSGGGGGRVEWIGSDRIGGRLVVGAGWWCVPSAVVVGAWAAAAAAARAIIFGLRRPTGDDGGRVEGGVVSKPGWLEDT